MWLTLNKPKILTLTFFFFLLNFIFIKTLYEVNDYQIAVVELLIVSGAFSVLPELDQGRFLFLLLFAADTNIDCVMV